MPEQEHTLTIGDEIRHRTSKGGYRRSVIIGIIESHSTTPDYLVENLDGTTEQLHWKECRAI